MRVRAAISVVNFTLILGNVKPIYQCKKIKGIKCDLSQSKGLKCKHCRWDRCLEIGLRANKVVLNEDQRKKYTGKAHFNMEFA